MQWTPNNKWMKEWYFSFYYFFFLCYFSGPRCKAIFEYIGDQKDELSFSEGEIIILKGYINEEWAKGELRSTSGIFPLNFVEVIEDLPESGKNKQNKQLTNWWTKKQHLTVDN